MGALNANLAYYRAMSNAGGFGDRVPEDQMLAEVWAQEADLRSETVEWLFPYLALAYSPLSTEDLQAYLDFSASAGGRRANALIFAAFDAVFVEISAAQNAYTRIPTRCESCRVLFHDVPQGRAVRGGETHEHR